VVKDFMLGSKVKKPCHVNVSIRVAQSAVVDRCKISFFICRNVDNVISPTFCGGIWA
jgi:hypothetical protein